MFIGYIRLVLRIPRSLSLKDKRAVVNKIKARLKNNFNIAISEKPSDKWQICELCVVTVNHDKRYLEALMNKVEDYVCCFGETEIVSRDREVI